MGCRPASQVQQTAFLIAMDKYMPPEYRHRIALYADDTAAGANMLEELFKVYQALVITLDKAGIQAKASKVEFGVEEVTFHNYRVIGGTGPNSNTIPPKDENLDPIQSCSIPRTITQLKGSESVCRSHATDGCVCPLLRADSIAIARPHQKGQPFPQGPNRQ